MAFQFDHSRWRPLSATRCAIGVAIPLFGASFFGSPVAGVLAGVGAIYAGVSSYNGAYGARLRILIAVSVCMAVVSVIGTAVSRYDLTAIVCVPVVAFVLSLYSLSSPAAQTIAVQSTSILIVLSGLPLDPRQSLGNGLLVLCGGLLQALILGVVWPVNPRYPERKALADVFLSLATFVDSLPDHASEIPDAIPFQDAWAVLEEAQILHPRQEHALHFQALRTGETIRACLVGYRKALIEEEGDSADTAEFSSALAKCLRQAASQIRAGSPLDSSCIELKVIPADPERPERDSVRWSQMLAAAVRELGSEGSPAFIGGVSDDEPKSRGNWRSWVSIISGIPDTVPLTSLAVQHAGRYALAIAFATVIADLSRAPHGFWLPLTVGLVLRQDYATTVTRAVSRLSGTLVGVVLATAINLTFHPSASVLLWLMVGSAWLGFAMFQVNYGAFAVMITAYVVFSISAAGLMKGSVGATRIVATALGGLIAVSANFIWPMWQSHQLRALLRDAVDAQIAYGENLREMVVSGRARELEKLRIHARSLRVQAEKLVEAAGIEPRWSRRHSLSTAQEAMVTLDMNAATLLSYQAEMESSRKGFLSSGAILTSASESSAVREALNRARLLAASLSP